MSVQIRVRHDATGYYADVRGKVIGEVETLDDAHDVIRAAANGHEWEVVEGA